MTSTNGNLTFEELYNSNSIVRAICDEAKKPKNCGSDFCRGELLHGMPQDHGQVGLFVLIEKNVPLEYQEMVRNYCRVNAPSCKRADCTEAMCSHRYLVDDTPAGHTEISVSEYAKLTPEEKNGKNFSLKRDQPASFGSLTERLRRAADGDQQSDKIEFLGKDGWLSRNGNLIDDLNEPVYIVRSRDAVHKVWTDLRFAERWQEEKISKHYCQNAIALCEPEARKQLLAGAKLTGTILSKPVILTFEDSQLERAIAAQNIPVVTVLPQRIGTGAEQREEFSLDEMRFALQGIKPVDEGGFVIPTFPKFTGSLVELAEAVCPDLPFCHKFMAALTLVGAELSGHVHFENTAHIDPRFYTILIDSKGSGKSGACIEIRNALSGHLKELHLLLSVDSGPALVEELVIEPKALLFADELSGLFEKAKIAANSRNTLFTELLTLHDGHATANSAKSNTQLKANVRQKLGMEDGSPTMQVDNAHFSMLGCVQPLLFESMWRGTRAAASGLQDRMTLASSGNAFVPEPQRNSDPKKVAAALERIARQIGKFQKQEQDGWEEELKLGTPHKLSYPDELGERARAWWKERQNREKVPARLPALISRVLMMLLITNDSDTVTSALLDQALAFGDYQIAMHQLMPEDAVTNVQEYEQIIMRTFQNQGAAGLTLRQLQRIVQPERRKLLGGLGPFLGAWKNLLSSGRMGRDTRGRTEIFWLKN